MEVRPPETGSATPLPGSPDTVTPKEATAFGFKVRKVPAGKTRKLLQKLGERLSVKSVLTLIIRKINSNWYNYLLTCQNPMEHYQGNLEKPVATGRRSDIALRAYLEQQISFQGLSDRVTVDDFLLDADGHQCPARAVKAAIDMFNADTLNKSSLLTGHNVAMTELPRFARDLLKADLADRHNVPQEEVEELFNHCKSTSDLRSLAEICDSVNHGNLWQKALGTPLYRLPKAIQGSLKSSLEEQLKGIEGSSPSELAALFLDSNGQVISVSALTRFKTDQVTQVKFHRAVEAEDLSTLTDISCRDLTDTQFNRMKTMLINKLCQAGMDTQKAESQVSQSFTRSSSDSLAETEQKLRTHFLPAWQPGAGKEIQRLNQLSEESIQVRRAAGNEPRDNKALARSLLADSTAHDLLIKDPFFTQPNLSIADIETSLDIITVKENGGSPIVILKERPLQYLPNLSDDSHKALRRFALSELNSMKYHSEYIDQCMAELEKCQHAHEFEHDLRSMLPGKLLVTEAFDTLQLPYHASERDISKKYRSLARTHHPDRFVESPGLSDEEKTELAVRRTASEALFKAYSDAHDRLKPAHNEQLTEPHTTPGRKALKNEPDS